MTKPQRFIQILIADDHEIVRCGLKSLLEDQDDLIVIGESTSCNETLALTSTLKPEVILLDINLSDGSCVEYIPELIALSPHCKILLFTAIPDRKIHLLAIRYGAAGILLKGDTYSSECLCKAIRHVFFEDELWIDEFLSNEILKQGMHSFEANDLSSTTNHQLCASTSALNALTPRENQIACLSAKGFSAKQIGKELFISEKTVRNQRTVIYSKLNVKNQLELAVSSHFMTLCNN